LSADAQTRRRDGGSDQHDRISGWILALGQRPERDPARYRERCVKVVQPNKPTTPLRVREDEDQAVDSAVTLLQRQAPPKLLHVRRSRLTFDANPDPSSTHHAVPGASVACYRKRDFTRPGPRRSGCPSESFQKCDMCSIPQGLASRVEPDRQIESDCGRETAKNIDPHGRAQSALDSGHLGLRDRSGSGNGSLA
jgi:hypothetical protein